MSFLGYGASKALAYKHDFQKDIDRVYQREAYASQVRAESEQKTQYWGELMKEHKPVNSSITPELEKYYDGISQKMSDLASNNPGWERDVTIMQEMMSLADGFLNNDLVREDKQGQQQFELLKQEWNSGHITEAKWKEEMQKYEDWDLDHNAVDDNGDKVGPYVYANAKPFGLTDAMKVGNDFLVPDTSVTEDDDGNVIKSSKVSKEAYSMTAYSVYKTNADVKTAIDASYKELEGTKWEDVFETPQDYYAHMLTYGEESLYDNSQLGDQALLDAKAKQDALDQPTSAFRSLVLEKYVQTGTANVGDEGLAFTEFGGVNNYMAMPANGKDFYIKGDDGKFKTFRVKGNVVSKGGGSLESMSGGGDYEGSHAMLNGTIAILAGENPTNLLLNSKGHLLKFGEEVPYDSLSDEEKKYWKYDEETKKVSAEIDPLYLKQLQQYGFKEEAVRLPLNNQIADMKEGFSKTTGFYTANVWLGSAALPAKFDGTNQMKYDKQLQTGAETNKNLSAGLYSDTDMANLWMQSAVSRNDKGQLVQGSNTAEDMAKSRLNDMIGNDIEIEYGVSRKKMEWKAHQQSPGMWYSLFHDKEGNPVAIEVDQVSGQAFKVGDTELPGLYADFDMKFEKKK